MLSFDVTSLFTNVHNHLVKRNMEARWEKIKNKEQAIVRDFNFILKIIYNKYHF